MQSYGRQLLILNHKTSLHSLVHCTKASASLFEILFYSLLHAFRFDINTRCATEQYQIDTLIFNLNRNRLNLT